MREVEVEFDGTTAYDADRASRSCPLAESEQEHHAPPVGGRPDRLGKLSVGPRWLRNRNWPIHARSVTPGSDISTVCSTNVCRDGEIRTLDPLAPSQVP